MQVEWLASQPLHLCSVGFTATSRHTRLLHVGSGDPTQVLVHLTGQDISPSQDLYFKVPRIERPLNVSPSCGVKG